ncbi:hypothetical protein CFP56_023841 [Quercus suber]|uniref:Uncharacterized protein n=1 Tax=Quercus suber TaxID=58331 RepID=A0AAW0K808_QUESU
MTGRRQRISSTMGISPLTTSLRPPRLRALDPWPKTSMGPSRRFLALASLWVARSMGKTLRICSRRSLMVMWKSLWTE